MGNFMYVVFFSTSDVFVAEERLKAENIECKIAPTPVTDRAYCGVCVKIQNQDVQRVLEGLEFVLVNEG